MKINEILEKFEKKLESTIEESIRIKIYNDNRLEISNKLTPGEYTPNLTICAEIGEGNDSYQIGSIEVCQMFNCCAYLVLTNAETENDYLSKGVFTYLLSFSIELAKHLRYSGIICTDRDYYLTKSTLLREGFKIKDSIFNKRSENIVNLYTLDINEIEDEENNTEI